MNQDVILVIGAAGTVGSELVRILRADGHQVRTATSKTSMDNSSVHINLATGEGVHQAFEGVDKAFLLSPPGYADQYKVLLPLIQEAKRRNLKKVVLMTALGVDVSDEIPFRRAEIELEKSGLTYNIVRPNWFMQNFNTFWIQGIREQSKILLPAGKAKTSFIDTKDVSEVIAKLLTTNKFDNKAYDLTGPKSLDHDEVALELAQATGKQISYQEIEPIELKKGLIGFGIPEDYVNFLITIFGFLREGYNTRITTSVKDILGREPNSFKNYAQTYKYAWMQNG